MKYLFLVLLFILSKNSFSQIGNDKWNITGELMLPASMGNKMFRSYMSGLVYAHPKIQYKPLKQMYIAFGPKYMFYRVNEFRVPFEPNVSNDSVFDHQKVYSMRGGMHVLGGDVEVGWTNWLAPRFALEIGVRAGVAHHWFKTTGTKVYGKQEVTAFYVEPLMSLVLAADEAVAYRWVFGYNFTGYQFNGSRIGSTQSGGYKPEDLKAPTQSLFVGFAISYYFKNQRSDVFISGEGE